MPKYQINKIIFILILSLAPHILYGQEKFKLKFDDYKPAVYETTTSPAFYIPASLTLLTFFDDIGKRITADTREKHNFWGTRENASKKSDQLRTLTMVSMLSSSMLFTKNGYDYVAYNMLFDYAAAFTAVEVRGIISDGNRRSRPNGEEKSFPSGHAAAAGARISLANYNIYRSTLSTPVKHSLASLNWALAYLTAYSRIESHNHYPEDVFAGIAIGYWVTNVIKKTFTNTYSPNSSQLSFLYEKHGLIGLQINLGF